MSGPVSTCDGSSGGAQPPQDPRRLPSHCESVADVAPLPHKGRGKAKGLATSAFVHQSGKIRLQIDEQGGVYKPVGDYASKYESALGIHTRDICEPYHRSWKSVPAQQRQLVHERLGGWFEIDYTYKNGVLYHMVERDASNRYRNWKGTLHKHFKIKGGPGNLDRAKAHPPQGLRDKSHWERCCEMFATKSYQKRSNTNSGNRSNHPYPSTHGRISYSQHRAKKANKQTHEPQPVIQNWRDMHTRAGTWVNSQAEETYRRLEERATQVESSGSDAASGLIDEISVMQEVLGRRRGHIRGVGPTLPHAASSMPPDATATVSLREHQEVVGRLDELTNAYTALHDLIVRLHPGVSLPSFGRDGVPPSSSSSAPASSSVPSPVATSAPLPLMMMMYTHD